MNKFFILVIVLVSVSFGFAMDRNIVTEEPQLLIREAQMDRIPGTFDAAAYTAQQREKYDWLMAEAVPLSYNSFISINVSEQEINSIEGYRCETCGDMNVSREKVRVGVSKSINLSLGQAKTTQAGGLVWTAAVESPKATALRVHFVDFNLPENAELYVYNLDGQAFGPYTGRGPNQDGDFWSNAVTGPVSYIQLHYFGDAGFNPTFKITEIAYIGQKFLLPFMQRSVDNQEGISTIATHCPDNAECVEDASCYGTGDFPGYNSVRYGVAHMLFVSGGWWYMCSGGLLNDSQPSTYIPYFLTANHCISKQTQANTLECYFQYWTASCHGACYDPVGVCPRTVGATFLAGSSKTSDFTLLRLSQTPPAGSVFLGWSTTAVANTNGFQLYRISYPMGMPQAYSEHVVDTAKGTCRTWPRGKWIYSTDTLGATQGGSSGSPVCNASGQVVGQLSGACGTNVNDDCDSVNNATVDGAFANYFSLISSWLN